MGLTRGQRRIVRNIVQIGKKRGESRKEIKAALETGRVEANFSNPKHATDHDSLGWRQERQMYYKNPTNLKASINRFYNETSKAGNGKGMSSGQLAQTVQRSAFPERYNQHGKEAGQLLRKYMRGGGGSGGSSTTTTKTIPGVDNSAARNQSLINYLNDRHNPDALLSLASELKQNKDTPAKTVTTTKRRPSSGGSGGGNPSSEAKDVLRSGRFPLALSTGGTAQRDFQQLARSGKVKVPVTGQKIKPNPKMLAFLADAARHGGVSINAFVGGKHSKGSQHYKGQAVDLAPNDKRLMRIARKHGIKVYHEDSAHDHYHV